MKKIIYINDEDTILDTIISKSKGDIYVYDVYKYMIKFMNKVGE